MTKLSIAAAVLTTVISAPAYAGAWLLGSEVDPFTNAMNTSAVSFMFEDSAVFIVCSSVEDGFNIGVATNEKDEGVLDTSAIKSLFFIAVDGKPILTNVDITTSLDSNQANNYVWEAHLNKSDAKAFLTAFGDAKDTVVVKEMLTGDIYTTPATGSSASARELNKCLDAQGKTL